MDIPSTPLIFSNFSHTSLTNQINQDIIAHQPIFSLCSGSIDYTLDFSTHVLLTNSHVVTPFAFSAILALSQTTEGTVKIRRLEEKAISAMIIGFAMIFAVILYYLYNGHN